MQFSFMSSATATTFPLVTHLSTFTQVYNIFLDFLLYDYFYLLKKSCEFLIYFSMILHSFLLVSNSCIDHVTFFVILLWILFLFSLWEYAGFTSTLSIAHFLFSRATASQNTETISQLYFSSLLVVPNPPAQVI